MNSQNTALIFDLDGTLWDTCHSVVKAWNEVLIDLGINRRPLVRDDIAKLMGLSHHELVKQFLPELSADIKERFLRAGYEREQKVLEQEGGELYPYVKEGLSELAKKYDLYLVSNCQVGYLDAFFQTTSLKTHFKDWECHGNTGYDKAENLRLIHQRNDLSNAVYIGDTAKDQLAAKQAGMDFLHVTYGFGKPAEPSSFVDDFPSLVSRFS